jgi:hypothetical protein
MPVKNPTGLTCSTLPEQTVPKIYLLQEIAVLEVHGNFDSMVLEVQSALYLIAGQPVHRLFC